mgnify:FL=1
MPTTDPHPPEVRAAALELLRAPIAERPSARAVAAAVTDRFGRQVAETTVRRWARAARIKLTAAPGRPSVAEKSEG